MKKKELYEVLLLHSLRHINQRSSFQSLNVSHRKTAVNFDTCRELILLKQGKVGQWWWAECQLLLRLLLIHTVSAGLKRTIHSLGSDETDSVMSSHQAAQHIWIHCCNWGEIHQTPNNKLNWHQMSQMWSIPFNVFFFVSPFVPN